MIRCGEPFADTIASRRYHRTSLALMTGPGDAIIDTAPSFAILNAEELLHCYPTGNRQTPTRQPQIKIVARDRGGGCAGALARALPHADQVADRRHLMENASHAFLDAVRKSMRQVRMAIGNCNGKSETADCL